jgi:AcrR family transcriptional regulator
VGKREDKSKKQRRAIIDAAVGVFSQKGFHKASVEEIAKRAGVGKGTIYNYFEDKSQLFAAAVAEGIEAIIAQLAAELESDLPFRQHLERLAEKNVSLYLKYGDLTKIFHHELSSGIHPKARRQIERVRSRYLDFIAENLCDGHRRGYLRQTDFKLSAVGIMGMLDALCDYQLRNRDTVDKKSVKDVIFMLLASGLIERDRPRAARKRTG